MIKGENRRLSLSRSLSVIAGSMLIGFLGGFTAPAAVAGDASGAVITRTVGNQQYDTWSRVSTTPGKAGAATAIRPITNNATAGEIGANARLYRDSGALHRVVGFYYNNGLIGVNNYYQNVTGKYSASGSFYSYGQVRVWNGSSYYTYNTAQTPNQSS